jgi:hypothetical protein
VDHFAPRRTDPSTSLPQSYLESRGVTELEFVCLTHPDDDHYRGMGTLLKRFSPRHLWLFPLPDAKTARRLAQYLALVEEDRCDGDGTGDELAEILDWGRARRKNGPNRCRLKYVSLGKDLYPSPEVSDAAVRIRGVGPADEMVREYSRDLLACFGSDGILKQKLPSRTHNNVSGALLIEWDQTRVLLGGDVPGRGWELILVECKKRLENCALVKVSHHGAKNGYCTGLWATIAARETTIAVLTPFHFHGLPNESALEHIGQHVAHLDMTAPAKASVASSAKRFGTLLESRQAIRGVLGAVPIQPGNSSGRCSYGADGSCVIVSREIIPPAESYDAGRAPEPS